jgi:hypothetical protein
MALARTKFGNIFGRRSESGTAAIEFGLFIPVLLILFTGTVELSRAMYEAIQVNNAVEAGMLYAAKNGWDSTGITNAVLNASTVSGLTATPAPSQCFGCPAAGGITPTTCVSPPPCADGSPPGQYVQVDAALPHLTLILPNSGLLPVPATFRAKAILRTN